MPPIRQRIDITAIAALLGAIISWGTIPVMLRYLACPTRVPDGFTANLVRYPIAAIACLPWLVWGIRRGELRGLWLAALLPSVINTVGQTLFAWAPYFENAGQLSFLLRIAVVWSILIAFMVFPDERRLARSRRFWSGAILAIAGFATLSYPRLAASGGHTLIGLTIIFTCSLFWAFYGVSVRYVMHKKHPLVLFSLISAYSSVGLIGMAPLGDPSSVLELSTYDWSILIGSALLGISLAHGLYYVAVQRMGVAVCELGLLIAPFISLAGSHLITGETFTHVQWLGGGILLIGAALAMASRRSRQARPPEPEDKLADTSGLTD
ncbi:MAG TPA: DMT family transporter [Phycisphaerae bacterium]|nr:DMT family transporter [Phycisphaerae bacterium]HRY68053.1 DMT family transporter [Phycisphaerae bacterium]HSA28667.1 DMT family transporter [Phycisphaerae bacterium]